MYLKLYTLSLIEHHFIFESFSKYQVTNVKHLVYHFWFLSIEVGFCQHINQSRIEQLTPFDWLEFGVYVSLCYCEVKIYNLTYNLFCITCITSRQAKDLRSGVSTIGGTTRNVTFSFFQDPSNFGKI
jgi:hypothetical protein